MQRRSASVSSENFGAGFELVEILELLAFGEAWTASSCGSPKLVFASEPLFTKGSVPGGASKAWSLRSWQDSSTEVLA